MMSGGKSRTTLSPACTVSICWAAETEQAWFGTLHFRPEHQPLAAYLLDDVAMLVLEPGETLLQPEPHLRDAIEKAVFKHHVEHSIADGHGERIAAESRAVAAGAS